ncbi:MAG: hypothetical protein DI535_22660 [Citrobacter freundii]|nr:MAG: hypothetical protein DI535_22660 [Citrobacter freundii]
MKSRSSLGALHPIFFFAVMYVVVLFLSIFICSSLFYSFNSDTVSVGKRIELPAEKSGFAVKATTAAIVH